MSDSKRTVRLGVAFCITFLLAPAHAMAASVLTPLVNSTGAIVIARIDGAVFDGTQHHVEVRVERSLKGTLAPGVAISADFSPSGPRKSWQGFPVSPSDDLLLFLNQDSHGSWKLVSFGTPAQGLAAAYFKVARVTEANIAPVKLGTDVAAMIAGIMASALEADSSQAARFLGIVTFSDSPAVYNSWSLSGAPVLKVVGLAGRISSGQDADAVIVAETLHLSSQYSSIISNAIRGYRNPDPRSVAAIGRMSADSKSNPQLVVSCAESLAAIHTRASVPYLVRLLDNSTPGVRSTVVGGLSAFVANMRIARDGMDAAEARDEVLNPGRQTVLAGDTPLLGSNARSMMHFGPFKDEAEEVSLVSQWKNWFVQNQARL